MLGGTPKCKMLIKIYTNTVISCWSMISFRGSLSHAQPIVLRLSHAQMPIFFGSLLRSHPSSKGLNLGEKANPLFQLALKFCLCYLFLSESVNWEEI